VAGDATQFGWRASGNALNGFRAGAACRRIDPGAALLALFVLKPMRMRHVAKSLETFNLSK
jgi:hypothetical protein